MRATIIYYISIHFYLLKYDNGYILWPSIYPVDVSSVQFLVRVNVLIPGQLIKPAVLCLRLFSSAGAFTLSAFIPRSSVTVLEMILWCTFISLAMECMALARFCSTYAAVAVTGIFFK